MTTTAPRPITILNSEDRFRSVWEAATDAMVLSDPDGTVLQANPAYCRLYGYPPEQVVGHNFAIIFPEAQRDWANEVYRQTFANHTVPSTFESTIQRADGELRNVETRIEFMVEDGRRTAMLSIIRDVTERTKLTRQLARQSEMYETILRGQSELGIGYLLMDGQRVLHVSDALSTITGYASDELRQLRSLADIVAPEQRAGLAEHLRRAAAGEAVPENCEATAIRKDGQRVDVALAIKGVPQPDGMQLIAIVRDITERKQSEAALLQKSAHLQLLFYVAARLLALEDIDGFVDDIYQRVAELIDLSGYFHFRSMPERPGWIRLAAYRGVDQAGAESIAYLQHGQLVCGSVAQAETPMIVDSVQQSVDPRTDAIRSLGITAYACFPLKTPSSMYGTLSFARRGQNQFVQDELSLMRSVSALIATALERARLFEVEQNARSQLEQRVNERTRELRAANARLEKEIGERMATQQDLAQSNEQLHALTDRLQSTREEERTRIAREIHDVLGGDLTGLKMDIMALKRAAGPQADGLAERLDEIGGRIDQSIDTVRRLATELRPSVLDDMGLVAALEWQLSDFQARSGIRCRFSCDNDRLALDPVRDTAVFRVFQETLTNIARHAGATRVKVNLEQQGGSLVLRVHDNGRGIETAQLRHAKSLGLMGMRERISQVSGQLEISGSRGKGTEVVVRVPMSSG